MSSISYDIAHAPPEVLQHLANTPSIPPPVGVTPNFVDPVNTGNIQIIVSAVMFAFTILFFLNRVYVKVFLIRKITWDDGTLFIAMLSTVTYYVSTVLVIQNGVGRHQWDLSILQSSREALLIPTWMNSSLTPLTFLFLKSSFFILYLQLFGHLKALRVCSIIGLGISSAAYAAFAISIFVLATPSGDDTWLAHQTTKSMKAVLSMSVPQSVFGLVVDLCILLIPIVGVWGLNMSLKRKIGVILIFFSGAMACVCSACSIYFRVLLDNTRDATWILVKVNICTLCEMFVGVICACMPAAAYAARQSNSPYRYIYNTVISFGSAKFASKSMERSTTTSHTAEGYSQPGALKSTDRKYAQYFNLTDMSISKTGDGEGNIGTTAAISSQGQTNSASLGIWRQVEVDLESGVRRP